MLPRLLNPRHILVVLDEIDQEAPSHTLARPVAMRRVFVTLASVSVALLALHYLKFGQNFVGVLQLLAAWQGQPENHYVHAINNAGWYQLLIGLWWAIWHWVCFFVIALGGHPLYLARANGGLWLALGGNAPALAGLRVADQPDFGIYRPGQFRGRFCQSLPFLPPRWTQLVRFSRLAGAVHEPVRGTGILLPRLYAAGAAPRNGCQRHLGDVHPLPDDSLSQVMA